MRLPIGAQTTGQSYKKMRLNLPPYPLKVQKSGGHMQVFDRLRGRYVALTPEEWVRQRYVQWLIAEKHFPEALMANEVTLSLNGTSRRCDTVVADQQGHPLVIVEYKAPTVALTQQVFDQIVRYNMVLHARYLMVSNGLTHYCCQMDYQHQSYAFMSDIPSYTDLKEGAVVEEGSE